MSAIAQPAKNLGQMFIAGDKLSWQLGHAPTSYRQSVNKAIVSHGVIRSASFIFAVRDRIVMFYLFLK